MRNITLRIGLVMMLIMLSRYSSATPVPQQEKVNMDAMTVAQLEKAGDQARGQKDYTEAIRYFQAAVRKGRKNSVLYNKLGLAELKNNNAEAAASIFRERPSAIPRTRTRSTTLAPWISCRRNMVRRQSTSRRP